MKLKMHWNFSADPCNGKTGRMETYDPLRTHVLASNITQLTRLNLTGLLPSEFADLTHLTSLDLSRNYLSGSIPAEWGSLALTTLAFFGNRISGRIPDELGNISTLQSLLLGANQLEGPIPATLGKITNLTRLYLASSNLSGELPETLGNLKNLSDFVIDGNPISGRIPSFIGNWTQLERLDMQGTSLEGPFPPILANLSSLTVLRVSDIRGIGNFPPLQNMKKMHKLAMRNLSIIGAIPDYIGNMTDLYSLFLTNNMLNGTIPSWILTRSRNMDVSYNDFTGSSPPNYPVGNVILISSYSSASSNSIAPCLRKNFPCSGKQRNYNVFINCGGSKVNFDNNEYEDDSSPSGASRYYSDNAKWASSSIGLFTDDSNANYIVHNASLLKMSNPELYTTARASPLSLRYFGLCLQKGNYNVSLHFAEIVFTDDQTFSSVGRRVFDVWIQGGKVLQDFDIAKEAKGTGKKIVESFNINVEDTLEIHF